MMINNSFQLKSNGFFTPDTPLSEQAIKLWRQLKERINSDLLAGIWQKAVQSYQQNPLMVSTVAGFSIVSLLLVMMVFVLAGGANTVSKSAITTNTDEVALDSEVTRARIRYELNSLALNLMDGDAWGQQQFDTFVHDWNRLDALEKEVLKHTVWFQLLENYLQRNALASDQHDAEWLSELALQLGVQEPAKQSVAKTAHTSPPVVAETVEEEARVTAEEPEQQFPEVLPNLAAQTDTPPALQSDPDAPPESAQANSSDSTMDLAAALSPAEPLDETTQPNLQVASAASPESQIASTVPAVEPKVGRVNRVIRTPEPQASAAATVKAAEADGSKGKGKISISDSELSHITSEFVQAYEAGNIINFTSLFADKAVSNDDSDLATIRKEYASLFATTSDRRMIIGDLQWDRSNTIATGKGKLKVSVKAANAKDTMTYSGTVQIVVEKQADGVQITKLIHALQ